MKCYSYLMTTDSGFAPNPFHGIMTLATCKPTLRNNNSINNQSINDGVFIAGFTSNALYQKINKPFPGKRLVFIMRVTKKVSFNTYWNDPEFQLKKPPTLRNGINQYSREVLQGDNIYECFMQNGIQYFKHLDNINHPCHYRNFEEENEFFLENCCDNFLFETIDEELGFSLEEYNIYREQNGEYVHIRNLDDKKANIAKEDLSGKYVFVSNEFFYFGNTPIDVIDEFKINVPDTQHPTGHVTDDITELWNYLCRNFEKNKELYNPHNWA